MRHVFAVLLLLTSLFAAAQSHHHHNHQHAADSSDVFYRHLQLNELTVTGLTGETKLKNSTAPISVVRGVDLRQTASTNIIDAVAKQPGMSQITTGSGISKPIIRGLGYNRIVVMHDGVRQEGQQWGDEHGIEIDAHGVNSVEILKGPASLMYGSDAMAGVLILHVMPIQAQGEYRASVSTEYQSNSGLFDYSLWTAGNHGGMIWDARFSQKMAHAYKNKVDGYVPGSQFGEKSARLMAGVSKTWGMSHLTLSLVSQTPSIIEGERDSVTGTLICGSDNLKTYGKSLPFQRIEHYKAVWYNSFNLSSGWLKAIVGYQQNRRREYEDSADDCELYFRQHTVTYDFRYLTNELDGWKMCGGLNGMWQQSHNLAEEWLIPAYRLFDVGIYSTVSKSLDRVTLNGGLRYDYRHLDFASRNFSAMTGSFGVVWNVCRHTNMRFNMARGFRAPNMSELGSQGVHEGTLRYEVGSTDLKPEYSWQADLGIDHSGKFFSAQAALFVNRIDNYIFAKRNMTLTYYDFPVYEYTQGDATLWGFELGVDLHPFHSLHLGNSFSYVNARQMHADRSRRYLPMTPAPRWTSELKYEITHHGHSTFNNAYVALGMDCFLTQSHYYRADQTETRTPGYALFAISAATDINVKHQKRAELYLAVDNLFNRAYQNHLSRLKYTDWNNVSGRQGVYNMGRNVVMKVVILL